ncbi:hypothetical protein CNR22_04140 [Sphingobacteriaceae bacterium]|nr:hypothetical protein CNR22_04140 [Sphingobacteriaceae bacterium]
MVNPIDKDKTTEYPGLIPYPHTLGSSLVKPEDVGKIKSRALSAMEEQTSMQLLQLHRQAELLASQAKEIQKRIEISTLIYTATMSFEPLIGHLYHLYKKEETYRLMLVGPSEWGRSKGNQLEFINTVKLLSDHTWEII